MVRGLGGGWAGGIRLSLSITSCASFFEYGPGAPAVAAARAGEIFDREYNKIRDLSRMLQYDFMPPIEYQRPE